MLNRKQHTINILLQAGFNKEFGDSFRAVADMITKPCPDFLAPEMKDEWHQYLRMMNHYEFMAVGIRYGDLDERLIRESHRTNTIKPFEWSQAFISRLRREKNRPAIFEHLEWLYDRWERSPPGRLQTLVEHILGKPLPK